MKTATGKLIVFVFLISGTYSLSAQSKSDKIFDTFRNKPGVSYFAFTKEMKDAFDINLEDEGKEIKGDLHEIRLLSYNPAKGNLNAGSFMKKATDMLPAASYEHLISADQDNDAEVWMLGNKKKASEFHVFVAGKEQEGFCFLISFYGDFFVDDVEGVKELGTHLSLDF